MGYTCGVAIRIRQACAVLIAGALVIGGCGGEDDHVNRDRPPTAINVTAAIVQDGINVSPREFGAGPIRLIVSNQTKSRQELTFESAGREAGVTQKTSPINPLGTATLEVEVDEGAYELRTGDRGIKPAAVTVGARRGSAQGELLQP